MPDITPGASLSGKISPGASLRGDVAAEATLTAAIAAAERADTTPTYEGEYTVVSQLEADTTMQTKGKKMAQDVTVLKIPQHAVSNEAGGITLILGGT